VTPSISSVVTCAVGLLLAGRSRILGQVTQPPYQPPNQPPYPPVYPQTPPYGYPQSPPPGYPQSPPPAYPQSPPGYPPAYGPAYGYQPGYSPPGGQPQPAPPRRRRLLWTWISFVAGAVVAFALFAAFAVQWALAANRIGNPDNTSATYGTVTAVQGSQLQVHVYSGTTLVTRTETHVFNRTNTGASMTHVDDGFDATVSGAPSVSVGNLVSFSFTNDESQGTYLAVAPSRIKAAGSIPVGMVVALVVGLILGIVGVVLFIVWLVSLRRNRRPTAPMYSPPPSYWPPNPQQQ
jgi:hypothetical protein